MNLTTKEKGRLKDLQSAKSFIRKSIRKQWSDYMKANGMYC